MKLISRIQCKHYIVIFVLEVDLLNWFEGRLFFEKTENATGQHK